MALVYHQMVGKGGLEKYVLGLAEALRARGHGVRLVTVRTDEVAERLGLEVTRIPLTGIPGWARHWVFAKRAASEEARDGEVVLGFGRTWRQDIHRAGGGCHALYSRLLPWWRRWGLKNRVELQLERRLYNGGATGWFVVNAGPVAAQLRAVYRVPADRVMVIHTAVDTNRFSPAPAGGGHGMFNGQERERDGRSIFLFVSSNHRRKGLPGLIRAMAAVAEARLWVAGADLNVSDRRLIARCGVQDRVRALGEVDDMVPAYREADWFIHPTLYDACANTVLQSMACELPGIISVADGASELIRDGENGLLLKHPDDPLAVAAAMQRALALNRSEQKQMGQAARVTVLPLTWEAHVAAWESLCQRVAAAKQGGRPADPGGS